MSIGAVTHPPPHSQSSENGDVACSPWMVEGLFFKDWRISFFSSTDHEWRMEKFWRAKVLWHSFSVSPGVAAFTAVATGSSCVICGGGYSHSPSILILPKPHQGCHAFSMEKLSYWLLFFLILDKRFILRGCVTTPNVKSMILTCCNF